jgi:inner membrane protein
MNAAAHRWTAAGATWLVLADQEAKSGHQSGWPITGGLAASCFTCLPDCIEPAIHPNHRQFFHSIAFAVALGAGLVKLHGWKPETSQGELLRKLGMVAIGGYLIHLALDATTAKSLPLVGRL